MAIPKIAEVFVVLAAVGAFGVVVYKAYEANANPAAPPDLVQNPTGIEVSQTPNTDQQVQDGLTQYVDTYGTDSPSMLQEIGSTVLNIPTGVGLFFQRPGAQDGGTV